MKRLLSLVLVLAMLLSCAVVLAEETNPYEVDESLVGEFTWWSFFDQTPFIKAEFEKKEAELQLKIAGDHVSLKSMYSIFGRGYVTLEQAMKGYTELLRPGHAKFYYDTGSGYTEQEMTYYDGTVSDDMKVCFDIPLPDGVKALRVDPVETSCIVRLTDATVKEAMTNGHVCGRTVFFDNGDPQFIFELPAGTKEFHIEYTIGTMDKDMLSDIGGRFTEYETAPKWALGKPVEKKAYDKISLLDGAN